MNYVKSNNPSLKYQRVTPSGRRYKGIRKFEFVAKTQFLYWKQFKVLPGVCFHIKFGPDQSVCTFVGYSSDKPIHVIKRQQLQNQRLHNMLPCKPQ